MGFQRRLTRAAYVAALGLTTLSVESTLSKEHSYTLAHFQLDAERTLGKQQQAYELLEEILAKARARISRRQNYAQSEAISVLRTIDALVQEYCPRYGSCGSLGRALRTRTSNCATRTSLYLSIADALDLPIRAVLHPDHAFVRWRFSIGSYLNWETMQGVVSYEHQYTRLRSYPLVSPRAEQLGMVKRWPKFRECSREEFAQFMADIINSNLRWRLSQRASPLARVRVNECLQRYIIDTED